jgi:CRP-like cAMP-binding protein
MNPHNASAGDTVQGVSHKNEGPAVTGPTQTREETSNAIIGRQANYFLMMSRDEQAQRIRRMAASGMSESLISSLTGYSVEQVRRVLGEVSP